MKNFAKRCIDIHKKNNRFRAVHRDEIRRFLVEDLGLKIKKSLRKCDMEPIAYEHLTPETIRLFSDKMKDFGLTVYDMMDAMDITKYRARKLIEDGQIRRTGTQILPTHHNEMFIYNMQDIIDYCWDKDVPKRKTAA